jgi:hypothetical protein
MAVTINAAPERVWPWLVQMGRDRGGWYSRDLPDNAGRRSAAAVHPEWQDLAVDYQLMFWASGRVMDGCRVALIEPNRFLGLYVYADLRSRWLDPKEPRPSSCLEVLWGFFLNELPDRRNASRDQRLPTEGARASRRRASASDARHASHDCLDVQTDTPMICCWSSDQYE